MKFNKTMYNTTGSGWYHANNNLGFYDKEIKGGFSYARPDYEYAQLIVNKDVIQSKHRELNEKRFGEEIKEMMNDFGVSRARYKQNVNKNMEMKTIINTYSKILVKMRDKDKEERTKLKNKVATKGETKTQPQAQPQQQQQQLQQSQPEQQPQLPQEQIQNQDEAITINNENNNIDTKEQTQIITPPPKPEEHHDKVNINNIQYISNFNEESAANFMDYINQTKNKEKTISINFKSSKLTKLDIKTGSTAFKNERPILTTSIAKTKAPIGVPKTAEKRAAIPQTERMCLFSSSIRNNLPKTDERLPPICSAAPSLPAEPPQR
jgi:hypothetical protein